MLQNPENSGGLGCCAVTQGMEQCLPISEGQEGGPKGTEGQ